MSAVWELPELSDDVVVRYGPPKVFRSESGSCRIVTVVLGPFEFDNCIGFRDPNYPGHSRYAAAIMLPDGSKYKILYDCGQIETVKPVEKEPDKAPPGPRSLFLSWLLVDEAVERLRDVITELMQDRCSEEGEPSAKDLHIVVLDPTRKPWNSTYEEAVAYEASFGDTSLWQYAYDEIAHNKARQSWNAVPHLPNALIHQFAPVLVQSGDTVYGSSYVDPYSGLIVGVSGVQGFNDLGFARLVSAMVLFLARDSLERVVASGVSFF